MGRPTSTPKYGVPLILFVLLALSSIAYGQGVTARQGVSYQKHIDDHGNVIMYEVRDQPTETVVTRGVSPAQEDDELQKLIDSLADSPATRAVSTVTDIDLSAYSAPRTATLYIRNGVNVRFVNGTLTRATSLTNAPLVQIIDDSRLHVSETAEISGNNFYASRTVLVDVLEGELDLEGGKIAGNTGTDGQTHTIGISVKLNNKNSRFVMTAGLVENLSAVLGEATASGGVLDHVSVYNHINIMGDVKAYCSFSRKEAYLDCTNHLSPKASIYLYHYYPDQTVAKNVPKDALNCFNLNYSENITGSKDDYQLSYENNSLVVRKKAPADPNLIYNEEQLTTRLKEIADKKESSINKPVALTIAPEGFTISRSVFVKSCYVTISGGMLTLAKSTAHAPFIIEEDAGLTLDNIRIDFNKFDNYPRGFDNYGNLTIGKGAVFLNVVSSNWYKMPFYDLYRGITTITPTTSSVLNEVFSIYFSNFQNNVLQVTSALGYATISGRWNAYDSDKPYTLVKGSGYTLTESDFKNMRFEDLPNSLKVYYDSQDHTVKLKKSDPNYITNEDDLQRRLDEIAAENPSKPVTLTIAEGGIDIGAVSARTGCKAKITGGPIKVRNEKNGADFAYAINAGAEITFENITLDFGNKYLHYSTFLLGGSLTIGSNVRFQNIYQGTERTVGFFVTSGAYLNIYSGKITANGSIVNSMSMSEIYIKGGTLESTSNYPTITGKANVYHTGGSVIGGYKVAILINGAIYVSDNAYVSGKEGATLVEASTSWYQGGTLEGSNTRCTDGGIGTAQAWPYMRLERIYVSGKNVMYGHVSLPMLYMAIGSQIQLASAMTNTWIIDGDWNSFDLTVPYVLVKGYEKYKLTENDFSRMQFANLPDDVEAAYNAEQQVVQLQKRAKECDLQSLIDGLCGAELPEEIPVPDEGVKIGCADDPLQCAVDQTIDGGEEIGFDLKPVRWICGCAKPIQPNIPIIRIYPYSSLTIRNYNIRSTMLPNQYIEVRGTLVIDVNVYIYNFLRFIHIKPGGRVVWRGGHVEDVDEIIYNENGTLEIEGDFDNGGKTFKNPEGSTLIIREGTFTGDIENHGTLIIEGGRIEGRIDNYGELTMRDCTVEGGYVDVYNHDGGNVKADTGCEIGESGKGCIWSETDIWIEGGVKVTDIHIKRGCRIHVIGKLTYYWRIHFFVNNEFDIYVPFIFGDGYKLTEADCKYIEIKLPEGYRWIYKDGQIVIVRIPYNVPTIVEYLEYFGPQGTPDKSWSFDYNKTNIDVSVDWHVLNGYHLLFDGGVFTMNGGNIYIDSGATLWLKNINFKGSGHIYVSGTLCIDANVNFASIAKFIHVCKGGVIRIVSQPSYNVPICIVKEHIVTGVVVIRDVKEAWLKYLVIDLPDGYVWEYDNTAHTVLIKVKEVDGILGVTSDSVQQDTYDLNGHKVDKPVKGRIYIRNGKKIVIAD